MQLINRTISFVILLLAGYNLTCAQVNVKISLDSAYIIMGKQTAMQVEILQSPAISDGVLLIPADTITSNVEIAAVSEPDTVASKSADQLMQIRREIILQSFDSGLYTIPPLLYLLPNGDSVFSNSLSLKVIPVNVDSISTIHSFAPVSDVKGMWWDFLPDFIIDYWVFILITLLIIAAGVAAWLLQKKKVTLPFMPKEKHLSPYEIAIQSLTRLREEKLCESGNEKEYYTRLTDILRQYLEGRFGIFAMEMTSTQILKELEMNADVAEHKELMRKVLEIADFVKFAKVRPLPADNVSSLSRAIQFVEDTKPAPEPEEETGEVNEEAINKHESTK